MSKQAEADPQKLKLQVAGAEEQHGAESLPVLYQLEEIAAFCRDHNLKLEQVNTEARIIALREKLNLSPPAKSWKPRSVREMTKLNGLLTLGIVFIFIAYAMSQMDEDHLVIPAYFELLSGGAGFALIIYLFLKP